MPDPGRRDLAAMPQTPSPSDYGLVCILGPQRFDPTAGILYLEINRGTNTMPLSIKDPETERLARDLARRTGETITVATRRALEERLRRVSGTARRSLLLDDLAAIRRRCAELPVLDPRTPDEIIGYDERGIPR
jgi:antitoxin VapB